MTEHQSWLRRGARIEVHGVDGSEWVICDGATELPVELDVKMSSDFYDSPVKTTWVQSAFGEGAQPSQVRFEPRDLVFAVHVFADTDARTWQMVDSQWRQAWSYFEDTTILIDTPESGTRELRCRMTKAPEIVPMTDRDPHLHQYAKVIMTVRAGQPFYTSAPEVSPVVATSVSGTAMVTVSNPGDLPIWPRWALDPGARWSLPDYDLASGSTRMVTLPEAYRQYSVAVDSNPIHRQIKIDGQPNAWQAMRGVSFLNSIPPHTPPTQLPVGWTGATGKPAAGLLMDRRWSRPWGLE